MGKPNCSFARYAEQFVKSGASSDAAPIPVDADESCPDKQVVGARDGVRTTQSAGGPVGTAAGVAAARAAKAPVIEAGKMGTFSTPSPRRGGSSRPPPSGDASRKRSSRESSVVDPSVAPEGLGLGSEGSDYRFSYNYPNKGLAFSLDNVECAKLAGKIPGGFSAFPSPDSLSEASFYSSWAQEQFKSIGAGNRMVDAYERRVKKAEKAESEARTSFVKERKNSDLFRKDLDKSTSELKSLKEKFDTETARLRASRDSWAKAEKEKADGYRVYADRLRRHILSEEAAKKDLQLLAQVMGMKECLEGLVGDGVPIPEEKMKQLADDAVKYHDIVNQFDIVDLFDGDLEESATAGPSRVMADGAAVPSRVAADGDDRVPANQ